MLVTLFLFSIIIPHLIFILLYTVHILSMGKLPSLTLNFAQEASLVLVLGMTLRYLCLNLLGIYFDQSSRFDEPVDQRATISSDIFLRFMHVT